MCYIIPQKVKARDETVVVILNLGSWRHQCTFRFALMTLEECGVTKRTGGLRF